MDEQRVNMIYGKQKDGAEVKLTFDNSGKLLDVVYLSGIPKQGTEPPAEKYVAPVCGQ